MKITEADVAYVAALANLDLLADETVQLAADLDAILAYVEKLNQIDTSAVEPMAQVLYEADESEALRADQDRPGLPQQQAIANAPESGAGQFKVPKVIER